MAPGASDIAEDGEHGITSKEHGIAWTENPGLEAASLRPPRLTLFPPTDPSSGSQSARLHPQDGVDPFQGFALPKQVGGPAAFQRGEVEIPFLGLPVQDPANASGAEAAVSVKQEHGPKGPDGRFRLSLRSIPWSHGGGRG
jgi:hypothetical protein